MVSTGRKAAHFFSVRAAQQEASFPKPEQKTAVLLCVLKRLSLMQYCAKVMSHFTFSKIH